MIYVSKLRTFSKDLRLQIISTLSASQAKMKFFQSWTSPQPNSVGEKARHADFGTKIYIATEHAYYNTPAIDLIG